MPEIAQDLVKLTYMCVSMYVGTYVSVDGRWTQ